MTQSDAEKLTKAQLDMLEAVKNMRVIGYFDVYAGYWWTKYEKSLPRFGTLPPLPLRPLLEQNLVVALPVERVQSGVQMTRYAITPAGRAALAAHGGRDG